MAARNLAHKSHLEEFLRYLIACGWEPQQPKEWEHFRGIKDGQLCIVNFKQAAKEHVTVWGNSLTEFNDWLETKKGQNDGT